MGSFLMDRPKAHVLCSRHVREQGVALEYHAHLALTHVYVGHVLAVNEHAAFVHVVETGDGTQQGGFATAGGAQQRYHFTLVDIQVDMLQNRIISKAFDHIANFNIGAHGFSSFSCMFSFLPLDSFITAAQMMVMINT